MLQGNKQLTIANKKVTLHRGSWRPLADVLIAREIRDARVRRLTAEAPHKFLSMSLRIFKQSVDSTGSTSEPAKHKGADCGLWRGSGGRVRKTLTPTPTKLRLFVINRHLVATRLDAASYRPFFLCAVALLHLFLSQLTVGRS